MSRSEADILLVDDDPDFLKLAGFLLRKLGYPSRATDGGAAALSAIAETTPGGDIRALAEGCMTPGGLNELAMKVINDRDGFAGVAAALEAVKRKIA